MAGWAKLHRKILENPIFKKPELYQLFSYCVLRANHAGTKIIWNGEEEFLEKGCFITGRKSISEDTGQNESAIYRNLKVLQKLNMISVKSNNKYSVVKVLNYCVYQGSETESEQPVNNQRTTSEQPVNTDKNDKNVKNDKKEIYATYVKMKPEEYAKLCEDYGEQIIAGKIEDLNNWKGGKGKSTKDDYLTIKAWIRKDAKEKPTIKPSKDVMVQWR